MTSWRITPPTARAAANVISRIRSRSGGREWQAVGIEDCLLKAADMADEPDLIIAMIRAAREPVNHTPGVIAHPGPHWTQAEGPVRYPQTPPGDRCDECQQGPGPNHPSDHEWRRRIVPQRRESRDELVERVRLAHEAGKAALCRHGAVVCKLCESERADPTTLLDPVPTPDDEPVKVAP